MSPDDYIRKAIHAIETDQPNLAMLYLRRGIQESKRLHPNAMLDLQYGLAAFADAMNKMADAFGEAALAMIQAFKPIAEIYTGYYEQADFALVSE